MGGFCLYFYVSSVSFEFTIMSWSLVFLLFLSSISFIIVLYSIFYMSEEVEYFLYHYLLIIFLLSIVLYSLSSSPILLLVFWDLLGVTSILLILFYNSWDCSLGVVTTAITMRCGDLTLILGLSVLILDSVFCVAWCLILWGVCLLLSIITKSALFPFSGWLPRAISAPTPISSLVHSSTLVVSGLFLCFGCLSWWIGNSIFLLGVSLLSLLCSGVLALVEEDYKKLVALSTQSQISLCCLCLSFGLVIASYSHILAHACVNSWLFICVGWAIYITYSQQDVRFLGYRYYSGVLLSSLLVCLLSLSGLFFSSISVTKELLLGQMVGSSSDWCFTLIYIVGLGLTIFYVIRLWLGGVSLFICWSSSLVVTISLLLIPLMVLGALFSSYLLETNLGLCFYNPFGSISILTSVYLWFSWGFCLTLFLLSNYFLFFSGWINVVDVLSGLVGYWGLADIFVSRLLIDFWVLIHILQSSLLRLQLSRYSPLVLIVLLVFVIL